MNKNKEEKSQYEEIEIKPEWLVKLIEKLNKKNE